MGDPGAGPYSLVSLSLISLTKDALDTMLWLPSFLGISDKEENGDVQLVILKSHHRMESSCGLSEANVDCSKYLVNQEAAG